MTKQNFMEQLIEELYRYFSPEQYQLEGSVLLKNNDTKRYAILLKKIEGTVSPTIYLDNFYSEFEHGLSLIHISALGTTTSRPQSGRSLLYHSSCIERRYGINLRNKRIGRKMGTFRKITLYYCRKKHTHSFASDN